MQRMALAALAACIGCSTGQTVILGQRSPRPYHFEPPQPLAELASASRTDNPTLTGDLLEIYFTTDRSGGNGDIWFATRASAAAPFGAPTPVAAVNGASFETSSAISTDGLTLWFGSDRPGGTGGVDVWVSQRSSRAADWSTPVNVVALNSVADDIPRPPGQHALVMPMASTRPAGANPSGSYQTYLAARPSQGSPFETPAPITELDYRDRSTVDGFLTDDGLTLFFSATPAAAADAGLDGGAGKADLYVAWRQAPGEPFSLTQPLGDLNTPADERDPWLTPDGRTLYFTSDRDGALNIYTAQVSR